MDQQEKDKQTRPYWLKYKRIKSSINKICHCWLTVIDNVLCHPGLSEVSVKMYTVCQVSLILMFLSRGVDLIMPRNIKASKLWIVWRLATTGYRVFQLQHRPTRLRLSWIISIRYLIWDDFGVELPQAIQQHHPNLYQSYIEQARKARRCDSYLQSETINGPLTHSLTHWLTGVGARRCYRT